ncbi:hypothetical protein HDV63DRAFT_407972 [Trichoderma sp. SZMC 28014]
MPTIRIPGVIPELPPDIEELKERSILEGLPHRSYWRPLRERTERRRGGTMEQRGLEIQNAAQTESELIQEKNKLDQKKRELRQRISEKDQEIREKDRKIHKLEQEKQKLEQEEQKLKQNPPFQETNHATSQAIPKFPSLLHEYMYQQRKRPTSPSTRENVAKKKKAENIKQETKTGYT